MGIHNQIWACKDCNGAGGKGTKGLYTFYHDMHPEEKKFQDIIDPLVEKKYLKTIYHCHECNGTLNCEDLDWLNSCVKIIDENEIIFDNKSVEPLTSYQKDIICRYYN